MLIADWRRQILELPSQGDLSKNEVRAAYWRLVGGRRPTGRAPDMDRLREAKRQLLYELGVRIPAAGRGRPAHC